MAYIIQNTRPMNMNNTSSFRCSRILYYIFCEKPYFIFIEKIMNLYIKMPLKYLKKYFMRKIYVKLRVMEVYACLRKSVFCLITLIRFYIKAYFLNITYIFYIWKINSYYRYKYLLILFYGDALYWYKYLNYYNIMKYMSKYYIYSFLIYIYNGFSYIIKNLIFWCENIIDTVLGYIFIRFFFSSFSHHRIFKFLMPPLKK